MDSPTLENELVARLRERNMKEYMPLTHINDAYQKLWIKFTFLENSHSQIKHALSLLEHETSELAVKQDLVGIVDNSKNRIRSIMEIAVKKIPSDHQSGTFVNFSKVLYDQKKLTARLTDELALSKSELAAAVEAAASAKNELQTEREMSRKYSKDLEAANAKIKEQEVKIRNLEVDNLQLIQRMMSEKRKSANELNEMNSLLNGEFEDCRNYFTTAGAKASEFIAPSTRGKGDAVVKPRTDEPVGEKQGAAVRSVVELGCHQGAINDVVVLHDEQHFVTAGSDSIAKIVDVAEKRVRHSLLCEKPVIALDAASVQTSTSRMLLLGLMEQKCRIWKASDGKSVYSSLDGNPQTRGMTCAKFFGNVGFVTGASDCMVRGWDFTRYKSPNALWSIRTESAVQALCVCNEGQLIGSSHANGAVALWDAVNFQNIVTLPKLHGASSVVMAMEMHPRFPHLMLVTSRHASMDSKLSVLDLRTYKESQLFRIPEWVSVTCPSNHTTKATFSSDGEKVLMGLSNGSLLQWSNYSSGDAVDITNFQVFQLNSSATAGSGAVTAVSSRGSIIVAGNSHGKVAITELL